MIYKKDKDREGKRGRLGSFFSKLFFPLLTLSFPISYPHAGKCHSRGCIYFNKDKKCNCGRLRSIAEICFDYSFIYKKSGEYTG